MYLIWPLEPRINAAVYMRPFRESRINNGTSMNLDELALNDTSELEIFGPNGERLLTPTGETDDDGKEIFHPLTFTLLRMDSSEAQKLVMKQRNARLQKSARAQKVKVDAKSLIEEATDVHVFCTRKWTRFEVYGGVFPCNAANARKLYTDDRFTWLTKQVDEFINEPANFVGNSSTSSVNMPKTTSA